MASCFQRICKNKVQMYVAASVVTDTHTHSHTERLPYPLRMRED